MIDLGTMFLTVQLSGGLPAVQSGGTKSPEQTDGFTAMFQRATEQSQSVKSGEGVKGAEPQDTGQTDLADNALDFDEDEIPEELAALAGTTIPPIIQNTQDTQDTMDISIDTDTVVSILESNTEIEAPTVPTAGIAEAATDTEIPDQVLTDMEPVAEATEMPIPTEKPEIPVQAELVNTADAAETAYAPETTDAQDTSVQQDAPVQAEDAELTARMPQTSGQTEAQSDDDMDVESPVEEPADSPRPLENKNNTESAGRTPDRESETKDQSKEEDRFLGQSQTVDIAPERLSSTEQLTAAAKDVPQATATPETLIDTMIENIMMSEGTENKIMDIQLRPEYLGKVSIQLSLGENGMEIKIKAEDSSVKDLIAGQLAQLTSSLSENGVKVADVDVVYTNIADHAYDEAGQSHQQQQQQSGNTSSSSATNISFGFGFTEEAETVSVIDTGESSVEYRA